MNSDKKKLILQVLNLVTFVLTIVINYAATLIPLGLGNTGYISSLYPNLFVPAGITFSIWGVIYVFLGLFVIYQIRDAFKQEKTEMLYLEKISYLFILSNIANSAWILFWHYGLIYLSIFAMLGIFLSLIGIYLKLEIGKTKVEAREKWLVHVPFSIYIGWITVATIANVTAVLVSAGVPYIGLLAEILTITVISVAVLITIAILYTRKDYAYSLVVLWAVLGIFLQQSGSNFTIATTAIIALVIIVAGILFTIIRSRK
jgi:hypothetical protein